MTIPKYCIKNYGLKALSPVMIMLSTVQVMESTGINYEKYGEWYSYLHYDNTVSNTLKENIFNGPFHLPRMLIILSCFEETGDIREYLK